MKELNNAQKGDKMNWTNTDYNESDYWTLDIACEILGINNQFDTLLLTFH